MKKILTAASVVFLGLFLVGSCASTGPGLDVPEVQPDKGLVVFYRPKSSKGAAIRFQITDGAARPVGALTNGTMIHEYVDPGQVTYQVRSPSIDGQDSAMLDVVAGQAYYLQGKILWGWPAGRPKFEQVSEAQARADLAKL